MLYFIKYINQIILLFRYLILLITYIKKQLNYIENKAFNMIQSEISNCDLATARPNTPSNGSYECIEESGINIPYKTFYMEGELNNLKNFYEM